MKEKKRKTPREKVQQKLNVLAEISSRDNSDVDGSYTGTPKEGGEPVQDADDL